MLLGLLLVGSATLIPAEFAGAVSGSSFHLIIPATPLATAGLAVDPLTGDLFTVQPASNQVFVVPKTSGEIFGQQVTANVAVQLTAASGLDQPADVVFDAQGDLFISNAGFSDQILVLPRVNGTVFGQAVQANAITNLNAAHNTITPVGMAFDAQGNLYVEGQNNDGWLSVIAASSGTLFGQSVTANSTTRITAMTGVNDTANGLAVDAAGDVIVGLRDSLRILPASSGTRFGTTLTANVATDLTSIPNDPSTPNTVYGVTLDAAGDLFYANGSTPSVAVIPAPSTTSIFGQTVTPGVPTVLTTANSFEQPVGLAFDSQGVLYIGQTGFRDPATVPGIGIVSPTTTTLFGVTCAAGQLAVYSYGSLLSEPTGVAVDQAGNVFVANGLQPNIVVVPAVSGTLFGQAVTSGVPAVLQASLGMQQSGGFALSPAGDLFFSDAPGNSIYVLTRTAHSVFGQSVPANTLTILTATSGETSIGALTFDRVGDLFISESLANGGQGGIAVLPATTSVIFGQMVVQNVVSQLSISTGHTSLGQMAIDGQGNLFLNDLNAGAVWVLPAVTGQVLGQQMTANVATDLKVFDSQYSIVGLAVDGLGDLYLSSAGGSQDQVAQVLVDASAPRTVFGQAIIPGAATVLPQVVNTSFVSALAIDPLGGLFISAVTGLWKLDGPPIGADELAATGIDGSFLLAVGLCAVVIGVASTSLRRRRVRLKR